MYFVWVAVSITEKLSLRLTLYYCSWLKKGSIMATLLIVTFKWSVFFTGIQGPLAYAKQVLHQWAPPQPSRFTLIPNYPKPNLILTLLCRHIFFLHIRESLLAGHLQCSPEQAVELSALLAQTKFGDYNQNTAKYNYEELCAKELSSTTLNRWGCWRFVCMSTTW